MRAYDAVKFGIKGTDYTIVLKNAGTRHYQQLVEFTSIMNDIVDETLGNADQNDYVRFVLKSSDFDRPLNIPCFGYALVLAINRLFTDLTGVQYLAENENRMINEVSECFKTSGVQYGAVDCTQYHLFLPCLSQNSRLIVVDAKARTKKLLYKSNVVDPNYFPVNNVCLLLFNNHYYSLTSLLAWYGQHYYCIECEVCYFTVGDLLQ